MVSQIHPNGRVEIKYRKKEIEAVVVYAVPALVAATKILDDQIYLRTAARTLYYYKNQKETLNLKMLGHYLAYIVDAFVLLGERDFVQNTIETIFHRQKKDGSIPEVSPPFLVCSTSLAQWAVIAYRLNETMVGDRCLRWLMKHQRTSGGFWGSYGFGKYYHPFAEISWTVKFFLDAVWLRLGESIEILNGGLINFNLSLNSLKFSILLRWIFTRALFVYLISPSI